MIERRSTRRVQLKARVDISFEDRVVVADTELCDLSLDAVCFTTEQDLQIDRNCSFAITVTGPSSTLKIGGNGRVIRQHGTQTVVKFLELEMDSYLHLKNLILLNRTPQDL